MIPSEPKRQIKRSLWLRKHYRIIDVQSRAQQPFINSVLRIERQLPDTHWPHPWLVVEGVVLTGKAFGQRIVLDGVRLQRELDRRSEVCQCPAYIGSTGKPFPHRTRAGRCKGPPYCEACGHHCEVKVDREQSSFPFFFGVRPASVAWSSTCCSAPVFMDWRHTIPYEDEA